MTVHCWGENPNGKWVLEIHNEGRYAGNFNRIFAAAIKLKITGMLQ